MFRCWGGSWCDIPWALSLTLQNKNSPTKLRAPGKETVLYKFYLRWEDPRENTEWRASACAQLKWQWKGGVLGSWDSRELMGT